MNSAMKAAVTLLCLSGFFGVITAECPPVPLPPFTFVTCDNGTNEGSECEVECDPGFSMLPESNDPFQAVIRCRDGETWDKEFPYCEPSCPPNAKADVVFLVDSSTSMRGVTRGLMQAFLREVISSWTISSNNVNVAIVPYSTEVMRQSVVYLNTYPNNKDGLLEAVDNLPRNLRGSLTGKALSFAWDTVLTIQNGNRADAPDLVIALTDGRGQDNIDPSLARLWNFGAMTCAVGFHPLNQMNLLSRQLLKIAQNVPERMHLTNRDSIGNTDAMMDHLKGYYCLQPATCNPNLPLVPTNGVRVCSDGNRINSRCSFSCDTGYVLDGDTSNTCVPGLTDPVWTGTTPVCRPLECDPPREILRNGNVFCSDENRVGSVCEFQCTANGYSLFPGNTTRNICLLSEEWDQNAPCCTRPCPPFARMDAVIVLDSSSSIGAANWILMKRGFTIDSEATNFAVVRYNREVDTASQILLRDFPNNKDGLLDAFDLIPYDGSGTFTGKAIQHVVDNVVTRSVGNRPGFADVVIVVTDGKAADDVLRPSNLLRATGATILVIGITPPRGALDLDQLRQIAGSDDNLFIIEGGFSELTESFAAQISDKTCGDPCSR